MQDMFSELMKNVDQQKLRRSLPSFMQLLSTPDGRILMEKIKTADPQKLMALMQQINLDAARSQLDTADVLLQRAQQDPQYIQKLIQLLEEGGQY